MENGVETVSLELCGIARTLLDEDEPHLELAG